jgi:hypothetical protein
MSPRARLLILAAVLGLAFAGIAEAKVTPRLVETPTTAPGETMAVLYSGDGGWGRLDQGVAKVLAAAGVPVLGVNSLRYFLDKRSPQQLADDLADQLRQREARWGRRKIVLVGYSFGADALPAIVPRLPADLRGQITGPGADRNRPARRPDLPPGQLAEPPDGRLLRRGPGGRGVEGPADDLHLWRQGAAGHLSDPAGRHHPPGQAAWRPPLRRRLYGLGEAVLRAAAL